MSVAELLLELTGEAVILLVGLFCLVAEARKGKETIPLLHLVEALKGWNGDEDDYCLLAVPDIELYKIEVSMRAPCFA